MSSDRPSGLAPARRVLLAAEAANGEAGHEVAGALSSSHGFLPRRTPALRLTPALAEVDAIVDELPALFGGLGLRRRLDALAPIDLSGLPDALLQRAATALGVLAQSYWHCDPRPPSGLPEALDRAWSEVCARMGREATFFSYVDGIVNNFRIPGVDRDYAPGALRAQDLRLLVPTVDNAEERVFYLVQVAVLMQSAPLVEVATRLQECALADDVQAAKALLVRARDAVQRIADVTLMTIDPNPASATHVDPTVWTRTVANTFLPIRKGAPGPSGTASPLIHLMDALIDRRAFEASSISRETLELRHHYPRHWRAFLAALGEVSLPAWIARAGDRELAGLFAQMVLSYVGESGFLGRHRLKVYGFLDTAFKIGRDATIGGFSQLLVDRTWDHVHRELDKLRGERLGRFGGAGLTHLARAHHAAPTPADGAGDVQLVRLDIAGRGLRYRPGDRLGVLPENPPALIQRTLVALGRPAAFMVPLGAAWQAALAYRPRFRGAAPPASLPLGELLRFARLRPVSAEQARAALELFPCAPVRAIVQHHLADELELWDLLALARRHHDGYDAALAGALAGDDVARLLPPEEFRLYSIASAPGDAGEPPRAVDLLVTRWRYATRDAVTPTTAALAHTVPQVRRSGTASNFLIGAAQDRDARARALFRALDVDGDGGLERDEIAARLRDDGLAPAQIAAHFAAADVDGSGTLDIDEFAATMARLWLETDGPAATPELTVQVVPPTRFALPDDPAAPIVMIAGGTGLSPFRAFWQERARSAPGAMNLLYFATRTPSEVYLREELEERVARGELRVRIAFSQAASRARFDPASRRFVVEPGARERIDGVLEEEREAAHLYRLLLPRDAGGLGGHFYVCGRSGFAAAVLDALRRIIARFHPGVPGSIEPPADHVLRRLVAENRLCLDVFTTHLGHGDAAAAYRPSDLVLRNCEEQGHWILVGGRILDMTEFRLLHPGGPQIIDNYAGIDATKAYVAVGHRDNPEIHAMAGMYEIGRLARIQLPANPVGRLADGAALDLDGTLRAWLRTIYAVTECENLLANEYALQDRIGRGGAHLGARSGLRTLHAVAAQERMESRYLIDVFHRRLPALWDATLAYAGAGDPDRLRAAIAEVEAGEPAARRRRLVARLWAALDQVGHDPDDAGHAALIDLLADLRGRNLGFLRHVKLVLRRGLLRFERLDAAAVQTTAPHLVRIVLSLPPLLAEHSKTTTAAAARHGVAV